MMDVSTFRRVATRNGKVYIERVPNAWVKVCSVQEFHDLPATDIDFLISKALKLNLDGELPPERTQVEDECLVG